MNAYTSSHWGIREIRSEGEGPPSLHPWAGDPDPNPIGLDQMEAPLERLRVRRPAVRRSWLEQGPGAAPHLRGREPFVEVDWETALDLVAREVARVKAEHGNRAIFGGSYGWASAGRFHHAQSQIHRFLNAAGGYVRHLNSYSLGAAHVILPRIVAPMHELMAEHTSWDVLAEHCGLFVSFGGVPWKNAQISQGGAGRHRVRPGLAALRAAGARIVNIGPVGDNLEEEGVEWIPVRPNTDTALMLALIHTLAAEGLADRGFLASHCTGFERLEAYLTGAEDGVVRNADWAAEICGAPAETIRRLARDMAAARSMVNMAWSLQRASHGEQPCWALVALAAALGQIGLPGGGFGVGYGATNLMGSDEARLPGPTLPQGENPVRDFIPVARIADMLLNPGGEFDYDGARRRYPDIRLVYWAGGNPWHHHQDLNRLARAWEKPETVVFHEQYWTSAARRADIVLPATTALEREDIGFANREGHFVAMSPAKAPTAEARDDYAVFADLARRLDVEETFTEGLDAQGWLRRLWEESRARLAERGLELPDYDGFREQGLIDLKAEAGPVVMLEAFRRDPRAHPLATPSGRIELYSETIAGFGLEDCPGHPVWRPPHEARDWANGDARLHLLSDQPGRKLHSQLDAGAHSRAGKVDGRERVWLNPGDAADRGLAEGDVVELRNARGRCLAAAALDARIMPGVARLATGTWHMPDAEGVDRRGNPNVLTLDVGTSGLAQGCVAQTCLVELRGPLNEGPEPEEMALPEILPRG